MSKIPVIGLGIGSALVLAGIAVIFWPASVIVAGLGVGLLSLMMDDGKPAA